MDTKSKNNDENIIKTSNKINKKVCVLMFAALFFFLAGFFAISNICFMRDSMMYPTKSEDVSINAVRYVKNLNRFYLYFENFDSKTAYDKLKELEKVISDKSVTNDETEKINEKIMEEDNFPYDAEKEKIVEEAEVISPEAEDLYFEKAPESYYNDIDIEEMKKSGETKEAFIIKYKELKSVYENYEQVRNYLKNNKSFQYIIKDNEGNVYTNNDNIENEDYYYRFSLDDTLFNSVKFNGEFLSASFEQNNLTGYIIIPRNIGYEDRFRINGEDYFAVHSVLKESERQEAIFGYFNYIIPVLFFIAFVLILYTTLKEKSSACFILKRLYLKYRKIPVCAKIILLILAFRFFDSYLYSIIGVVPAGGAYYNVLGEFIWKRYEMAPVVVVFDLIMFLFLAVFFAMVCILSIMFIIDIIRKPSKLKDEFEIKFIQDAAHDTKYIFYTQSYGLFVLYLFLLIGTILSLVLFGMVFMLYNLRFDNFYIIVIVILEIVGLITVYEIIKLILAHCKLSYCIENMAEGNDKIVSENSKAFKRPFDNLKVINNDINKKIEEMMKNERLKTELITNVSHDLKTPLTSIINYIDLLKEEKIDNDSAREYVEILDGKSQRLKTLIDDLFEASKLSSNQFKLDVSKSDVVALLKQTLGEMNNKIEESNINFIIELPNNPIFLDIDGQQIWRVFDNLLNNILKYSPEKSRAYISIEETETEVKIIMKNISKAPLNFDADELFERFKRGDKSRTTEGSGLGLSIAKSIVELHSGNIFINIDGDLFKVIVLLKK